MPNFFTCGHNHCTLIRNEVLAIASMSDYAAS